MKILRKCYPIAEQTGHRLCSLLYIILYSMKIYFNANEVRILPSPLKPERIEIKPLAIWLMWWLLVGLATEIELAMALSLPQRTCVRVCVWTTCRANQLRKDSSKRRRKERGNCHQSSATAAATICSRTRRQPSGNGCRVVQRSAT